MLMAVPSSLRSMFRTLAVLQAWGLISCITMLMAVPPSLRSMFRTPAVLRAWGIISCLTTVSYTHLDVYKRQDYDELGETGKGEVHTAMVTGQPFADKAAVKTAFDAAVLAAQGE